ncbi:TniB family NTP-binding protein [Catenulispora subtropica]|uniref:ATP-binding protein n=1 Tax=Catenulispora subtropica TaxID=450798 RepID=A0ABN2RC98_9ACTN
MTAGRTAQPRTKEQWRVFCARTAPEQPQLPTYDEYLSWDPEDRAALDARRNRCHANPPITKTEQVKTILAALEPKLTQNEYAEEAAYHSAVINGPANCGKTSLLKMIGKEYELGVRRRHPERGDPDRLGDWVPVVYVSASTGATAGMLSQAIGKFLHVPVSRGGNKWTLTDPVLDALAAAGTELLLLDDLHMLDKIRNGGDESNDHIKNLANHAAVTIIGAGILLEDGNLFSDGQPPRQPLIETGTPVRRRQRGRSAQFGSRFSDLQHLAPFKIDTAERQRTWMSLVRHFERNLLLFMHRPDSLTLEHWQYLHDRTSGYIGSLATLFEEGAHLAVEHHIEQLNPEMLENVVLDHDAETEYAALKQRRAKVPAKKAKKPSPPSTPTPRTGTG